MAGEPQGPRLGLAELAALYPYGADEPAALLELSFGHVLATRELLGRHPKARLVIFVPDERRERWARQQAAPMAERVRLVRADPAGRQWVGALPGGFHLICLSWGIEEVAADRRPDLIDSLASLLRPGGLLCVMAAVAPASEHLLGHCRRALCEGLGLGDLPPTVEASANAVGEGQLRFWLESAALRPVDLFWKLGPYVLALGMRAV